MARNFRSDLRSGNRALRITAAAGACLVMAGCQSTGTNDFAALDGPQYTHSVDKGQVSPGVKYWSEKFEANPHDIRASVGLSRELRKEEKYERALGIMLRATSLAPNDPYLFAEMGKIMVERGSPTEGLELLDQASKKLPSDWSIMSARGIAHDHLEDHRKAQDAYQMALTYSPGNPVVLANYGLSLAMEGRLGEAENMLRKAAGHPEASKAISLNLALIIGLKGDFEESERIARAHLAPGTVEENMAYLRSLLTQPARWRRPDDGDYEDNYAVPRNMPS